jgi:UDP-N-acetylglucosamine diphosphorylase/glucosamine-1-phosphate N-acetyltransferase
LLGEHVAGFTEADEPSTRPVSAVEGPALVGAAWFAPTGIPLTPASSVRRLVHGEETVGWVVPAGEEWRGPSESGPTLAIDGIPLRGTFDLLTALEQLLSADCADFLAAPHHGIPGGSIVLGNADHVIVLGASVEPGVVFDVRQGAVVLDQGAEVRSGSRLEGPLYVGPGTKVLGGFVRGSVFGPECRIHGEVSTSVFHGFANKSHDGFVGHSIIGQWVNLGAGTTTSNLKNTYGPVRLEVDDARIETGRLNVGSLIGDHAKTAIGSMLGTGTVISSGANVFGATMLPKYIPPFAWGCAGSERMTEDGFLRVAERVMGRRNVAFSPARRESLRRTYQRSTG